MFASCKKLVGVRLFGSRLSAVSLRNMHHKIRCARLTDIERIDACNRACMTENYHKDFYDQHILRWPELSLVAISEKDEQMMGYVLGRIEELPCDTPEYQETASGIRHEDQPPQHIGHLVSVSTFPMYRGHGIAQDLLKRLHFNFSEYYAMDAVNLFCRENTKKLFQSHFEYKPDGLMPGYYESGEDAHVMTLNGLMLRWSQLAPEEREKLRQQNKILQPMDSVRTIWVSSGVEKHGSKPTSVHEERSERPRVTGAGAGGAAAGRSQGPTAPPGSAGSPSVTATAGDWRSGQRIKLGGDHNDYP